MTKASRIGTTTPDLDRRIDALQPGHSLRVSGDDQCWVTCERSADGKWLNFIRHTPNGWNVFHGTPF